MVIEVAARSIGGLCSRALRFGAGVSLEEVIVRHAIGAGLKDLQREAAASGVMMLPIRAGGVLEEVSGQAEALAVDGVVGLEISIAAGRPVVPLPEGDRYLGFVFARGRRRRTSRSPCAGPRRPSSSPSALSRERAARQPGQDRPGGGVGSPSEGPVGVDL